MDLSTLRSRVRVRLGVPDSDAFYTNAVLNALVNDALHHVEAEDDWRWLEAEETVTTTAADPTYALPARYRSSISVHSDQGFELNRATVQDHLLLRGATGVPKVFDVSGAQLRLAPTPNGAYTLYHLYIGGEPDLVADGDTPLMPAVFHAAIVEYAAYLAWRRWGPPAEAGSALAAYESWLEQMKPHARGYSPSTGGGETPPPVPAEKS